MQVDATPISIASRALHRDTDFQLTLVLAAGKAGLERRIVHAQVQRAGLPLAGLVSAIVPQRVQVMGHSELAYLATLTPTGQIRALTQLLQADVPAVILTRGQTPPPQLLALADSLGVPLYTTTLDSDACISRLHAFLADRLSPAFAVHGVLLDVFGVGVLLTGQSGIGKSECALDLVLRGHRLVGDDTVLVRAFGGMLMGIASPVTQHHMEIRGLGILSIRDLFGAASVCQRKSIDLVVEMVEWQRDAVYDRLGLDQEHETIMRLRVAKVRLPIRPGRNVASIVEVAARNHLLKEQGYHAAHAFQAGLERQLAANSEPAAGGS